MGRLVVEALGSAATGAGQSIAAAGNRDPMPIVVSVTDANGVPVSGLEDGTDFTIEAKWVDQGIHAEVVIAVTGIGEHGDYRLAIIPGVDDQGNHITWAAGRYIFLVTATKGGDQGQTLCDVVVH